MHELRVQYIGPDTLYAGIHIRVRGDLSVEQADLIADEVRARLHSRINCQFCTVHVDPGEPTAATLRGSSGCGESAQRDSGEIDADQRDPGFSEDTTEQGRR